MAKAKPLDAAATLENTKATTKRSYVRQADMPKTTLEEALKLPQALQDNFGNCSGARVRGMSEQFPGTGRG